MNGFDGGIWQVTQNEFQVTQTSALVQKFMQPIRDALGVDWATVQWRDLRKPLYSGIAAMLSLIRSRGTDIPRTKELQGLFYQKYVATGDPQAAYKFVQDVDGLTYPCGTDKIDLAFLVDVSVSLHPDDFIRSKKF